MPTVFLENEQHEFESVKVKRNGYVVGIDGVDGGVAKNHYPPQRVRELEGDVQYERRTNPTNNNAEPRNLKQ